MGNHINKDASCKKGSEEPMVPVDLYMGAAPYIIRVATRLDDHTTTTFDPTVRLAVLLMLEKDLTEMGFNYSKQKDKLVVWSTAAPTQHHGQTLKTLVDNINRTPVSASYEDDACE